MKIEDFAKQILQSGALEDKLYSPSTEQLKIMREDQSDETHHFSLPQYPARESHIQIHNAPIKFPSIHSLHNPTKRGLALHFFANHELLAIEMCAAALVIYPHLDHKLKWGILNTLFDEQKHLRLYLNRMYQLGVQQGDYPLNSFFWDKMHHLKNIEEYLSAMSLTFESANLDFARFYQKIFQNVGDSDCSKIMEIVYQDEIKHVSLGVKYLEKQKNNSDFNMDLWSYYRHHLPFPLTPARAKGIEFDEEARMKAGIPLPFIEKLKNYRDDYKVTGRKTWK